MGHSGQASDPLRHHPRYGGSGLPIPAEAKPLIIDWIEQMRLDGIASIISFMHDRDLRCYRDIDLDGRDFVEFLQHEGFNVCPLPWATTGWIRLPAGAMGQGASPASVALAAARERDSGQIRSLPRFRAPLGLPLHSLDVQDEIHTRYIWGGGELRDAPDFFDPVHVDHLAELCPEILPYLALPPGWRVLLAPGHEDVWYDPGLLDV